MKILLVDDNPDDLQLARYELSQLGHAVIAAENGTQALALFEREQPEVVITDIYMPGMDGFALTRAVQQRAAPRWQPVMFLSGHRDDDLQVKALETGADAYIVKPVAASLLDAKLHVIQRLLVMQRQAETRAYELERHYIVQEEERRLAKHLLERMIDAEKLADPALRHWLAPAAAFGGDLVAAARTPGGVLHVLLADGSGYGLSASINMLPITPPFYRMTEKGFGIEAIVREINGRTRHFLPPGHVIAATLVAVDFREGLVQVWNGGNPEPCLLDAAGHAVRVFSRSGAALGAIEDGRFDSAVESHAFGAGAQLILYSDGLLEAENGSGDLFGHERLARALINAPAERRLEGVMDAVSGHLDGTAQKDDISVVLIEYQAPQLRPAGALAASRGQVGPAGNWRISLRLGAHELRQADVVPLLLGLVGQFDGVEAGRLFLVLSELFNNALEHGLLRLGSRWRIGADGIEPWLREREGRLAGLVDGEISLEIEQLEEGGRQWLRVACRDSGPGFDPAGLGKASAAEPARGIALVRSLCAQVQFNGEGNAVSALMALGR